MSQVNSGLGQLDGMRERRKRQAPEPRYPKLEVAETSALEPVLESQEEPVPTVEHVVARPVQVAAPLEDVSEADTSTTMAITSYITAETLTAARRLRGPGSPGAYVALEAISAMQPR